MSKHLFLITFLFVWALFQSTGLKNKQQPKNGESTQPIRTATTVRMARQLQLQCELGVYVSMPDPWRIMPDLLLQNFCFDPVSQVLKSGSGWCAHEVGEADPLTTAGTWTGLPHLQQHRCSQGVMSLQLCKKPKVPRAEITRWWQWHKRFSKCFSNLGGAPACAESGDDIDCSDMNSEWSLRLNKVNGERALLRELEATTRKAVEDE